MICWRVEGERGAEGDAWRMTFCCFARELAVGAISVEENRLEGSGILVVSLLSARSRELLAPIVLLRLAPIEETPSVLGVTLIRAPMEET